MALRLQQFGGAAGGSTFTIAEGTFAHITNIYIVNVGAITETFDLTVTPNGGSAITLFKDQPVVSKDTVVLPSLHLAAGDQIGFVASSANLVISLYGESFG